MVICDNARYHHSKLLADWLAQHERLSQKFLPAYSPNLNLIERLWKWMKKKVTATVYYPSFAEFKKAVLDLFARLPDYQQELHHGPRQVANMQLLLLAKQAAT